MTGNTSENRGDRRSGAGAASLHLNTSKDRGEVRTWKTFDWDAMNRLHEKGFIDETKSKAKSAALTASKEAFRRIFT